MAELPFGDNPFSSSTPAESAPKERPTASFLARQIVPPTAANTSRPGRVSRKRDKAATWTVLPQGEVNKKGKHVESTPDTVFSSFSDLAKDNYKAETINVWKERSSVEVDFCLRQALGEVYIHGLDRLNAKDKEIAELKVVITKYRTLDISRDQELASLKKKSEEEAKLHKEETEKLQMALEEVRSDLKSEEELHSAAISSIQAKFDEALADKRKELSEAYTQGFLGYLKSFLGAHHDYDWSVKFPPSTVAYMEKFKVDNAEAVEVERARHASKSKAELEKIAADEAGTANTALGQEDQRAQTVDDTEASPSQATEVS